MESTVRVGVVGLGFMGQVHVRAVAAARKAGVDAALVAVADSSVDRLHGRGGAAGNLEAGLAPEQLFDAAHVRTFADPGEMFARAGLDAVVIATPTDTHEQVASAALRAGLNVLLEKPVAIRVDETERLLTLERSQQRHVMPAMCIRFWPGWTFLKECIDGRPFGPLYSIRFARIGSRPEWSPFYRDESRSGGALFDLHIHDADFVLHALGRPRRVLSIGSVDHLTTIYDFAGTPGQVVAEGGWLASPGRSFRMRYCAEFERATVEFDLGRSPTVCVTSDGVTTHPELPTATAYEAQMEAFLRAAMAWKVGNEVPPPAPLSDALTVTHLLLAEKRSLQTRQWEPVPG